MKKLLKKIGVLGLIIAILAPFIELPTVNAAEGCTNHLQNYLWLDMNYFTPKNGETFWKGIQKIQVQEDTKLTQISHLLLKTQTVLKSL